MKIRQIKYKNKRLLIKKVENGICEGCYFYKAERCRVPSETNELPFCKMNEIFILKND